MKQNIRQRNDKMLCETENANRSKLLRGGECALCVLRAVAPPRVYEGACRLARIVLAAAAMRCFVASVWRR